MLTWVGLAILQASCRGQYTIYKGERGIANVYIFMVKLQLN